MSTAWRARHASMIPLFMESQNSSDASLRSLTQGTESEDDTDAPRGVEATQSKVFSATQQTGKTQTPLPDIFVGLFIYLFLILGLPPFPLLAMSAKQRIDNFLTHHDLGWFESLQHRGSAAFSSYLLHYFCQRNLVGFLCCFHYSIDICICNFVLHLLVCKFPQSLEVG